MNQEEIKLHVYTYDNIPRQSKKKKNHKYKQENSVRCKTYKNQKPPHISKQ